MYKEGMGIKNKSDILVANCASYMKINTTYLLFQ